MKREIIETGRTVDEAIESACEKLGCKRDECELDIEILDLPKKGFLGLKTIPAKVRVAVGEDEAPAPPVQAAAPAPAVPQKSAPPAQKRERAEKTPPVQHAPPQVDKPREKPAPIIQPEPAGEPIKLEGALLAKAEAAKSYLQGVLAQMELHPELTVVPEETGICITVQGEGLGAVIGRRGETLDSLQYLTGLVVNRLEGDYLRVTVDCGNYRQKRRATLEALAHKLSSQVLKTNISKTLEPMNPFERRIIHSTVSEIEGVSSSSVGEEPNRRVIITSPTARPPRSRAPRQGSGGRDSRGRSSGSRNDRGGYSDRGGYNRGGDRRRTGGPDRRRDTRSQPPVHSAPANPPKEAGEIDKPLYSKIDLE